MLSSNQIIRRNRWGSTYDMIQDVLNLRQICEEAVAHGNVELYLSTDVWTALEEIRTSLELSYIATVRLQSSNAILTDVRKIIDVCWMKTAEIGEFDAGG